MKLHYRKTKLQLLVGGTLALLFCGNFARADVKLDPLFSNNMVLQRGKPIPVWGSARAGERVTIRIGAQKKSAVTDATGAWRVTFDAMPAAGSTPFVAQGDNKIELKNVAVGEVWICSGQSNMVWQLYRAQNGDAEVAAANDADLRFFTVPAKMATAPQTEFAAPAQWEVCTPQSAHNFSAVAYFFGRELRQKLKIPVGLVSASWGGSTAETWVRRESLAALGKSYQKQIADFDTVAAHRKKVSLAQDIEDWWQTNDIGTRENWQAPETATAAWKTIELPGAIERVEKDFDGMMWFRREFEIPESWAGKDLVLRLGAIEDYDDTFFNGVRVGTTRNARLLRNYEIPGTLVKAGRAVIATRVYDLSGPGGLIDNPANRGHELSLYQKSDPKQILDLNGVWQYHLSAPRIGTPPFPTDWHVIPSAPSTLTNGMIAPLVPFSVRGVIWYQGESNVGYFAQYRTLFPALIRDWRTQWNAKQDGSDFPFYFVQLANYMMRVRQPVQSGWAELREAQTMTLSTPGTGMALAIDVGEAGTIHPLNKQAVGQRLALVALAKTYGQALEYSGPMFEKMENEGSKIRLHFSHAGGLKTSNDAAPESFAISGEDGKWFVAQAKIDGETIMVWSDNVPHPVAVRYAWKNNPAVNLINSSGLPAVPFRTDAP
jgi:sialate O-acetylesterase